MSEATDTLETNNLKWIQATALGDRSAFESLYQANAGKLLAIAYKLLGRKDMAEEVLQEAFVKVWHNADNYHSHKGSVLTWLISIVRHRCLDELRHQQVHRKHQSKLPLPTDISDNQQQKPDADKLYRCMALLQGSQRHSIQLAYFYGLTQQEIVSHLQAPLGSIKSWIKRGLESLKRCLKS